MINLQVLSARTDGPWVWDDQLSAGMPGINSFSACREKWYLDLPSNDWWSLVSEMFLFA